MKNIYDILQANGITVPDEAKEAFEKELYANYKSVNELEKKEAQIAELNDKLKTATDGLKAFEGVDVDQLKGQISKLTSDLEAKDAEWANKFKEEQFNNLIGTEIAGYKGRNDKAIRALLDMDALKASQNQQNDVKAALGALKEANPYLFEDESQPPKYAGGTGKGGSTGGKQDEDDELKAFMLGAGIKTE